MAGGRRAGGRMAGDWRLEGWRQEGWRQEGWNYSRAGPWGRCSERGQDGRLD